MRLLLMIAAFAAAQAQSPQELALKGHFEKELQSQFRTIDTSPEVVALVQTLAASAAVQISLNVKTLELENPVANVLPGNLVYVSTGLLNAASEAEVEAVMAHVIGHIAAGHARPRPVSSASLPLLWMGSTTGICSRSGERAILPPSVASLMAKNETEADALAVEYLKSTGLTATDPAAAFTRLQTVAVPARKGVPTLRRETR